MTVLKETLYLLLLLFSLFSAAHAILHKRDPRAALAWSVTCLLLGGVGALFYWLFGVNRIRTHAQNLNRLGYWKHETEITQKKDKILLSKEHPLNQSKFQ